MELYMHEEEGVQYCLGLRHSTLGGTFMLHVICYSEKVTSEIAVVGVVIFRSNIFKETAYSKFLRWFAKVQKGEIKIAKLMT